MIDKHLCLTPGAQLVEHLLEHHGVGVLAGEHLGGAPAAYRFGTRAPSPTGGGRCLLRPGGSDDDQRGARARAARGTHSHVTGSGVNRSPSA